MTGALAVLAANRRPASPITASSNWGTSSNTAPAAVTSPTRTLTVPAGNPGNLSFSFSPGAQYSKNGGAFASLGASSGNPWASGDTLAFRNPNPTVAGVDMTVNVTDATTGTSVGSSLLQPT